MGLQSECSSIISERHEGVYNGSIFLLIPRGDPYRWYCRTDGRTIWRVVRESVRAISKMSRHTSWRSMRSDAKRTESRTQEGNAGITSDILGSRIVCVPYTSESVAVQVNRGLLDGKETIHHFNTHNSSS